MSDRKRNSGRIDSKKAVNRKRDYNEAADDKRPDDKRPDDKRPDDKRPDDKRPDDKRPDNKRPDNKRLDNKRPDNKRPDNKKPVNKGSDNNRAALIAGRGGKRTVSQSGGVVAKKVKKQGCPYVRKCGGCGYRGDSYEWHLKEKQARLKELLGGFCRIQPIIGMEEPFHYRNKVHAVFGRDRKGNIVAGTYREGSHEIVPIEKCMIEDEQADAIIGTIRNLLKSFKIKVYDEDSEYGLLRHVLIKKGFRTGEIMVVLVTASPILPSKNNFVKALLKEHPEITTIIQNVNYMRTSMVLGQKEQVLYGKGVIEDVLCGIRFRISAKSFYQINPLQTEKLYAKALEFAQLTGKEIVIDAYSGIGTIGLIAAARAKQVLGVELNRDAVRDAIFNAKRGGIKNTRFFEADAGEFMVDMADEGLHADVVFMDPPRSGSTEQFMDAVAYLAPARVVYISCNPESLQRDLRYFASKGYRAARAVGVDMFPWTGNCEVCVELCRNERDTAK